jgi:hypothetical protein
VDKAIHPDTDEVRIGLQTHTQVITGLAYTVTNRRGQDRPSNRHTGLVTIGLLTYIKIISG